MASRALEVTAKEANREEAAARYLFGEWQKSGRFRFDDASLAKPWLDTSGIHSHTQRASTLLTKINNYQQLRGGAGGKLPAVCALTIPLAHTHTMQVGKGRNWHRVSLQEFAVDIANYCGQWGMNVAAGLFLLQLISNTLT